MNKIRNIKGPQILKLHYETLFVLFSYVSFFGGSWKRTYVTLVRFRHMTIFGDDNQ
jgi:hypothetical protein